MKTKTKQEYISPETTIVVLTVESAILTTSPGVNGNSVTDLEEWDNWVY